MSFAFNEVSAKEFAKWTVKFPDNADGRRSLVIPALRIAQRQHGWINMDVVEFIAELTGVAPMDVWGVATFYTMFNTVPVGRILLQFCNNISCGLNDSEKLIEHACARLGIKSGETTPDGLFTIMEVECLGDCGNAPVVQVNDRYHERMTAAKLDELINKLKEERQGS